VNGQDGVARVIGVEEEAAQLRLVEGGREGVERFRQVLVDTFALLAQLQKDVDIVASVLQTGIQSEILLQTLLVLVERLGPLLVLPDFGRGQGAVYGLEGGCFAVEVKENPGSLRIYGPESRPGT